MTDEKKKPEKKAKAKVKDESAIFGSPITSSDLLEKGLKVYGDTPESIQEAKAEELKKEEEKKAEKEEEESE